jgi:hypothetical protein
VPEARVLLRHHPFHISEHFNCNHCISLRWINDDQRVIGIQDVLTESHNENAVMPESPFRSVIVSADGAFALTGRLYSHHAIGPSDANLAARMEKVIQTKGILCQAVSRSPLGVSCSTFTFSKRSVVRDVC